MSEPIIFISNQRVKEGKLEGYKHYYRQVAEQAKADNPVQLPTSRTTTRKVRS